jgi:hypothetical protein
MAVRGGAKFDTVISALGKKLASARKVKVGFLAHAPAEPGGAPVAMIAAVQNFGAPSRGIPPRPFFSAMIAKHGGEWGKDTAELLVRTGGDAHRTLVDMGELMEGQLRQSIVDTNTPPDSPVTDLLKQRFPMGGQTFADVLKARADVKAGITAPVTKPLVQSGHLLGSVDSEVIT